MMNNTINEIKNSLEGISSRITKAEEWISDLEDKIVEITTAEQNKEKRMKKNEPHPNPNPNPKLPLTASASNRFPKQIGRASCRERVSSPV